MTGQYLDLSKTAWELILSNPQKSGTKKSTSSALCFSNSRLLNPFPYRTTQEERMKVSGKPVQAITLVDLR